MKVISWNVNGIRAISKKGFLEWMHSQSSDILCLQEVRASQDQIPSVILEDKKYPHQLWFPAQKGGYSGVGILSRTKILKEWKGMGHQEFDSEGRVIAAEWEKLVVVNAYFPNSQDLGKRLDFKIEFCKRMEDFLDSLKKHKKPVVLCGDYNIAHEPIDLARPDENEESPGYFPREREWMSHFLKSGWVDSFRELHPKKVAYSWWSMRTRARERNIGWRIDYHCLDQKHSHLLKKAEIYSEVNGSDHCPVYIGLDL